MMHRRHAFVARLARDRGFLDPSQYAAALSALDERSPAEDESFESFWVLGGWLQKEQLDELLSPGPTRDFGDDVVMDETRRKTAALLLNPTPEPGALTPLESREDNSPSFVDDHATTGEIPVEREPETKLPQLARYETRRLVGMGGMGDVWEVLDKSLERRVALKVARHGSDQSVAKALAREARVAGSLEHPSIVPVYDAGQDETLGPFYAMRLLDQPTLEDVILQLCVGDEEATRKYGQARLLRYYIQICQAVHYAHSRGVVHCDLKPSNVVVGDYGEVMILDWGLAFKIEEGITHNRGGTPGYMAPEQLHAGSPVDRRADVFALGSILYEIISLHPAYDSSSVTEDMINVAAGLKEFPVPVPPHEKRPDVPLELEQICLRAMSLDAAQRHDSAAELAADIEAFLEGTRERERRDKRAAELTAQGDQLADMYREYVESRPRVVEDVTRIRAGTAPWAGAADKRELWDAEDRLAATDAVGIRTFQAAVAAYEQALDEKPGHAPARAGLAALYALEVERARERRDALNRIYFEELVKQYSDNAPLWLRPEGLVRVRCLGGEGSVAVSEYHEDDRRMVPVRERLLGSTPIDVRMAAGSHLLRVGRDGGRQITLPLFVTSSGEQQIDVDLEVVDSLLPGEIYVPGGPALLGGDELSPWGADLCTVDVPPFVIAERPVTFDEYLQFLTDLKEEERARHLPMNTAGVPHWVWDGQRFVPSPNFNFAREEALLLPAFGVTLDSAQAYTAWRLLKTGHTYRLPREDEWEKAARGVDGRVYPWGDYFDPHFCKMVQSRPGQPKPEPSGAFAADISPYGVRDLSGGVADWIVAPEGVSGGRTDVARGGAWCDWRADCRVATRRPYQTGIRTSRVGFRLARDP
jgi:eukaryotic-like serine/threonine-protein kinase